MLVSIVTPTYNESENIANLLYVVAKIFSETQYDYEHIIVDNCSTDSTIEEIDKFKKRSLVKIKTIINAVNRGPDYSPFAGFAESAGDVVIPIVADFQDPPELITALLAMYEKHPDTDAVICINESKNPKNFRGVCSIMFYWILKRISLYSEQEHFQGFGLYSRNLVNRMVADPYRYYYFRGLLSKYANKTIAMRYRRPERLKGKTSYNWVKLIKHAIVAVNSQNRYFWDLITVAVILANQHVVVTLCGVTLALAFKSTYTTE